MALTAEDQNDMNLRATAGQMAMACHNYTGMTAGINTDKMIEDAKKIYAFIKGEAVPKSTLVDVTPKADTLNG